MALETNDSQNDHTEYTEINPENFYPDLPDASPETIPKWLQENKKNTHLTKEIQYPEKEIPHSDAHDYFTDDFLDNEQTLLNFPQIIKYIKWQIEDKLLKDWIEKQTLSLTKKITKVSEKSKQYFNLLQLKEKNTVPKENFHQSQSLRMRRKTQKLH